MKVFVFSTHNFWPNHRETELEIIQNHLDAGDDVYRIYCNGHLSTCDINLNHDFSTCLQCRDTRVCGDDLLTGSIHKLPILTSSRKRAQAAGIDNVKSLHNLESLRIDNFDIGFSVLCSICTLLREPNPDVIKHQDLILNYVDSAISVYESAKSYFARYKPKLVYVFNGRFAHVKAVWRAAQYYNIDCIIHERGYNKDHYELYRNTTPHDKDYVLKCMLESWEKTDMLKRVEVANDFYKNRSSGKEQGWLSFIGSQKQGVLPDNWDSTKRNVVIFHTSEDEFANVGPEWRNFLYETQLDGIKRIATDMLEYPEIQLYLRVHPSLRGIMNTEVKAILELNFSNLTVIIPESSISSYDLLFNSEKVISFGSTMGIEAVYWGKPSLQLGHAYYNDLGATYQPSNHEMVIQHILARLQPKPNLPALIYGHYFNSYGAPFKNYRPTSLFSGLYNGTEIIKYQSSMTRLFIKMHKYKLLSLLATRWQASYAKLKKKMLFPDWL